jgi:acyl dehydratase
MTAPDKPGQRFHEDVAVGDVLAPLDFPLTLYRMVMAAGANRDFNAIHHNSEHARSTGADELYANNLLLQGMWERCVRDFIGTTGTIRALRGFRMSAFNYVGDTVRVEGSVSRVWHEGGSGLVEIALQSSNGRGVSVGPGSMIVALPLRADGA